MMFGYPDCCIDFFIDRAIAWQYLGFSLIVMPSTWPLNGTGFAPCPRCAATYTDQEMESLIAVRRLHPTPFPDGDHDAVAAASTNFGRVDGERSSADHDAPSDTTSE